jgi:succinate dehydrogenase / fumarate reductase cytochrome b subunit
MSGRRPVAKPPGLSQPDRDPPAVPGVRVVPAGQRCPHVPGGIPVAWAVQSSVASPDRFDELKALVAHPLAKLVVLGLVWAYVHHLLAGVRHLALDLHVGTDLKAARHSSTVVFVVALALTAIVGIRLW